MFDLSRFTEALSDLIGHKFAGLDAGAVLEQLGQTGLDLQQLQGLDAETVSSILVDHGIDIAAMDPSQLTALSEQLGVRGDIADIVASYVDRRDDR